jgi:hypothetical protein
MVNNDPILWTMLNAIKEQQKEIEQLKEKSDSCEPPRADEGNFVVSAANKMRLRDYHPPQLCRHSGHVLAHVARLF